MLEGENGIFDIGNYTGTVHVAISIPEDGAVMLKAGLSEETGS